MNTHTDFPCSHPHSFRLPSGQSRCADCHAIIEDGTVPVPAVKPHRPDFALSDTPEGYRAGLTGEKVGPGKGWERLEEDLPGAEAWMELGETCEEYHLTEASMKHRIKVARFEPSIPKDERGLLIEVPKEFLIRHNAIFQPTFSLRWVWRKREFDPVNLDKVLQQLWLGSDDSENWRDIPTVSE